MNQTAQAGPPTFDASPAAASIEGASTARLTIETSCPWCQHICRHEVSLERGLDIVCITGQRRPATARERDLILQLAAGLIGAVRMAEQEERGR